MTSLEDSWGLLTRPFERKMERQALATPGIFFEREEAGDKVFVVLETRPPLLLDPVDGELEWYAGGLEQNRDQGEIDCDRLTDELRRIVPVEIIEQDL